MKHITRLKLTAVHMICEQQNKPKEFMIQAMQDVCDVPLDCVMGYLENNTKEDKLALHKELMSLSDIIDKIEKLVHK